MGDSTCLLQSFSNPTDISPCIAQKVDPIRLLGESISFGKYMSEGLDWEKWSVFSHNRYVEEAEKFSKPGSVAAKKAYFEAHYKKKAAHKTAATVQEEAGGLVNETFDSETQDGNCNNNSSVQMNSKENSNVTVVEQHEKYDTNEEDKRDIQQNEVEICQLELPKDMPQPLVDNPKVKLKNFVIVDNSNQFDNVEKVAASKVEKLCDPGIPGQVKAREVKSFPKSSTKATVSKPLHSLAEQKATGQTRSRISNVSNGKRTVRGSAEKKRLSTKSLHMSINLPSCSGETSKTASVLQQNRIKKNNSNSPNASRDQTVASQTSARVIRDIFNRASVNPQSEGRRTERLLSKSVCEGVTASAEVSSPSVVCQKSPSTRHPQSSTISSPFRFRCEGRVAKRKEAIRDIFNRASVNTQSEGRRMEKLNKSVCKGVAASVELPSPSVVCPESPSTRRPQSSTVPSPFRFRSEGRVAKRKEFFQRMDDVKSKEVERMQLQRKCKEKTDHDHKKLQQCSGGFKPKQKEDTNGVLDLRGNEMKKTSLTQPQSPKPGSKATSSTCHGKNSRNSWKPPTGISTPKLVSEKMNQTMRGSFTSLSKVRRENTPPNIQP